MLPRESRLGEIIVMIHLLINFHILIYVELKPIEHTIRAKRGERRVASKVLVMHEGLVNIHNKC